MRNTNAYALLCLLSCKPMSGYTMKQHVDQVLSHFWKTSYGQIYPTMRKFLEDDLVTVEEKLNDKGQICKYYSITDKGVEELKEWLAMDTPDFNYRDESLLKFFFSSILSFEDIMDKAHKALDYQNKIKENYIEQQKRMRKTTDDPTLDQMVNYLAVKKGIYLNEARAKWAQECIEMLNWFKEKENNKKGH